MQKVTTRVLEKLDGYHITGIITESILTFNEFYCKVLLMVDYKKANNRSYHVCESLDTKATVVMNSRPISSIANVVVLKHDSAVSFENSV